MIVSSEECFSSLTWTRRVRQSKRVIFIERVHDDPVWFAQNDPDHFDFLMAALHGVENGTQNGVKSKGDSAVESAVENVVDGVVDVRIQSKEKGR